MGGRGACALVCVLSLSLLPMTFPLQPGASHVIGVTRYKRERYKTLLIFNKYRSKAYTVYICENNWFSSDGISCSVPLCKGKTTAQGACQETFPSSHIVYAGGRRQTRSEGLCSYAERCTCNKLGFYSAGNTCQMCSSITNCDTEKCSNSQDQTCELCHGVIQERPGYRAYVASSNKKLCNKACSWEADSTRCYPGTCANELASRCSCSAGFTGTHCQTLTAKPTIKNNEVKLTSTDGSTVIAPADINQGPSATQNNVWTNIVNPSTLFYKMETQYIPSLPPYHAYVLDAKIGVIGGKVTLTAKDSSGRSVGSAVVRTCGGVSRSSPQLNILTCQGTLTQAAFAASLALPFSHRDRLDFDFQADNGGYVEIDHKRTGSRVKHYYTGTSQTHAFQLHFDTVNPYHCTNSPACEAGMLSLADVTMSSQQKLTWQDWRDDDAGIRHFTYTIYDLHYVGSQLTHRSIVSSGTSTQSSVTVTMTSGGMFSTVLSAVDRAGNLKSCRRVFLYDASSKVVRRDSSPLRVTSAAEVTSWRWQQQEGEVRVTWTGRYSNDFHHNSHLLAAVQAEHGVESPYEDRGGTRSVSAVSNVLGIVQFRTAYSKDSKGGTTLSPPPDSGFQPESDLSGSKTIQANVKDGESLTLWVRAYDIRDQFYQEAVTVHVDSSPPVIQNLWLTKDHLLNISVHGLADLHQMTIEWEAYDPHSGLKEVKWRVYDDFTGTEVLHGLAAVTPQGNTQTLSECQATYGSYPRGPNCYCTGAAGCFHRHFQVRPSLVTAGNSHGGIFQNKNTATHDHDYYLEVTVFNHANLSTSLRKQITVDLSPPEPGTVHDGMSGSREVDYQSERRLHAHWSGFFDRESGVKFYQVAFDSQCLDTSAFAHNTQHKRVQVTYNTFASWEAPGEGQYYVTVVAYNRAMEKSRVVCSDGVRIDSTPPSVTGVYVSGARGPPGVFLNNTSLINTSSGQAFYLAPQHHLYLNWSGSDAESGIHDYEVGLATSSVATVADISGFVSTHQHAFYRQYHPALPEGKPFFILLAAVNRAGLRTVLSLGPVTLVRTPPRYSGKVTLTLDSDALRVTWDNALFNDVNTSLLWFTVALEEETSGTVVHPHTPATSSSPCNSSSPPSCASFPLSSLHWGLHHQHVYRAKVKVTNIVGLDLQLTSDPYVHDTRLAAVGRVFEVVPEGEEAILAVQNWEDTDYQLTTSTLRAKWSGFQPPSLSPTYRLGLGTAPRADDVSPFVGVASSTEHVFKGLSLQTDRTYYVTVVAMTSGGNVTVSSDGVTVIQSGHADPGVQVLDGPGCASHTENRTWTPNHHKEVVTVPCEDDVRYQISTSSLWAHWNMTSQQRHRYPDVMYKVQTNIAGTNVWSDVTNYTSSANSDVIQAEGLSLQAGGLYRLGVRWCVSRACSLPVFTSGVYVITRPPVPGSLSVRHDTATDNSTLRVVMERWRDGDIKGEVGALAAMLTYQWTLTQGKTTADLSLLTAWRSLSSLKPVNTSHVQFQVALAGRLSLKKCVKLRVQGTNRVGMVTVIDRDVEDCRAVDPAPVTPRLVIDAVGSALPDSASSGQPISLGFTEGWGKKDRDYTPFPNLLSAVWPSLRHSDVTWAVLASKGSDVTSHFQNPAAQPISDPCSSPLKIACGVVSKQKYVNVHFGPQFSRPLLENGRHYYICIQAKAENVTYEKWTEQLTDVSTCSDGVTVDLTSPDPGTVWVDRLLSGLYQRWRTVLSVRWSGFTDIEELGQSAHHTAILSYQLAVGSVKGGEDVYKFHDVGVVNDVILHNLTMQDGHVYYVTVKARDHVGRTAEASSKGFVVDTTPPSVTSAHFRFPQSYVTSTSIFSLCWTDKFADKESGIDHYLVTLGSRPGHHDLMKSQKVREECREFRTDIPMLNGHSYYVTVTAVNGADQQTAVTSQPMVVMTTPLSAGQVMDGPPPSPGHTGVDLDFVNSTDDVRAWWTGFGTPLSPVTSYSVRLGTCPGCGDVIPDLDIGLAQEVRWSHAPLRHEVRYYTTVTACNALQDCSTVTSDGVMIDVTPPMKGTVWDGTGDEDTHYQAHRDFLGAQWRGFRDTGSGLRGFSWRAGTSPGGSEVMPTREVGLVFSAFSTRLPASALLPEGVPVYITVTAADTAGNKVEVTSKGLQVDSSGPVVREAVKVWAGRGSLDTVSLVSPDLLAVQFAFADPHSHLHSLHLSLHSHLYGQFQPSPVQVPGPLTQYKFTALTLHDGSVYNVKATACNLAGLCTTSVSADILHDHSPPTTGMLAIQTDHAADLRRAGGQWMKWTADSLTLAWLGFHDQHSGVHSYRLAVGSKPFASDLNTGGQTARVTETDTNSTNYQHEDEGFVQVHTLPTSTLTPGQLVYVTLWAVNGVGLESHPAMSQLQLVQGGSLMLVRRCSSFNCLAHCACSVQGATCGPATSCTHHTPANNPNALLTVLDQADLSLLNSTSAVTSGAKYQASQSYLAATWRVTTSQGLQPIRYEISAGRSNEATPKGVFNSVTDRVWRDVGLQLSSLIVLPRDVKLTARLPYSTFVRAWYSDGSFAIFKSSGITPIITAPTPTSLLARAVKEHSSASATKDVDFVTSSNSVHVSWTDKFVTSAPITSYQVFIGTRPEAADIFTSSQLPGSQSRLAVGSLRLREGAVYYSTVTAQGSSGLVTWDVSDGFSLDRAPPEAGAVWDGTGVEDLDFQSSNATISATWHGFYDVDSAVRRYVWCVGTAATSGLCDVIAPTDVGLMTSAKAQIASPVAEGTTLYSKVYAEDAAGRRSEVKVSDGVTVDVTGPEEVEEVYSGGLNLVTNPSFEDDTAANSNPSSCDPAPPSAWQVREGSCVSLHRPQHTVSARGLQHAVLSGTLQQSVSGLKPGHLYRLSVRLAHPHNAVANQRPVTGHVTVGEIITPFALDPSLCRGVCDTVGEAVMLWHSYHFLATASSPSLTIAITTTTTSPDQRLALDDVILEEVGRQAGGGARKEEGMRWSGLFLAQWSMVQISWHFVDSVSPIVDYQWALGTSRGGVQLQSYVSVGRRQHASLHGLTLTHGSRLHVTLLARNAAGLTSVAHSRPLVVDMTPPEFGPLLDGSTGDDVDYQNSQVIAARWSVTDPQSSVDTCQWAIGKVNGRGDIRPFLKAVPSAPGVFSVSADVTSALRGLPLPLTLYVSVRCYNKAGLPARATTDGVTIVSSAESKEKPSLTLFPDGVTQYPVQESCHARADQLRVRWGHFASQVPVVGVEVSTHSTKDSHVTRSPALPFLLASALLNLTSSPLTPRTPYSLTVSPVNLLGDVSAANVTQNSDIMPAWPSVNANGKLTSSVSGSDLTLAWPNLFKSDLDLSYEVTAGSVIGGGEIIQWQQTQKSSLVISLAKSKMAAFNISVVVTAVDPCGQFAFSSHHVFVQL